NDFHRALSVNTRVKEPQQGPAAPLKELEILKDFFLARIGFRARILAGAIPRVRDGVTVHDILRQTALAFNAGAGVHLYVGGEFPRGSVFARVHAASAPLASQTTASAC